MEYSVWIEIPNNGQPALLANHCTTQGAYKKMQNSLDFIQDYKYGAFSEDWTQTSA